MKSAWKIGKTEEFYTENSEQIVVALGLIYILFRY